MKKTSKFAFLAAVVAIGISSPVLAKQSRAWPDVRNTYRMDMRDTRNAYTRGDDFYSMVFTSAGSSGYNRTENIH